MSLQKVEQYADPLTEDRVKEGMERKSGKRSQGTFIQDQVTRRKWRNQVKAEVVWLDVRIFSVLDKVVKIDGRNECLIFDSA